MAEEAKIDGVKVAWLLLVLVAPPAIIWLAAWIFNNIIEVGKVDFGFLSHTIQYRFLDPDIHHPFHMPFVPSSVVLSLYAFGFLACLTSVLSIATAIYGAVAFQANLRCWIATAVACGFMVAMAIGLRHVYANDDYLPAAIAQYLIKNTLYFLPMCGCDQGIGNTGNSLADVVGVVMGIVAVGGTAYWMAALAIVWSESDEETRRRSFQNLTTLAAATFLMSVVTAHLLFQPGADMILAAYLPDGADGKLPATGIRALENYSNLRNAMTWYWGTVFSLAMCSAYFPTELSIPNSRIQMSGFDSIWKLMGSVVTVISPLIASGALQLVQSLLDMTSSH
ncbi:hypothetical protein [Ensifer sp. ENS11]|uniref:hypothetical protein n=1 Tax=Ensifer sp. ENS11 TaxID=2769291 RepID=UPI00177CFE7F|nr:hypothetical protein [Ensifer sp. ENS11]MBD9488744.1 hypothetical protein [Ensifer sp. ENS11]